MATRFLHCGDIHLGHDNGGSEERAADFARAFGHIVTTALTRQVAFVIISGDLFDRRNINAQTLSWVLPELERLRAAAIPVVAVEGNHDKAFYLDRMSWLEWLAERDYLVLLKPTNADGQFALPPWDGATRRGACLELPTARIYGLGYLGAMTRERLSDCRDLLPERPDRLTIVILHAIVGFDALSDAAGLTPGELAPLGERVHYLALGHRHGRLQQAGWIHTPGAPEACDISEADQEKGFFLVTVPDGPPRADGLAIEFIPSQRRPAARVRVDLTGTADVIAAGERILAAVAGVAPTSGSMLQVVIGGAVEWSVAGLSVGDLRQSLLTAYGLLSVEVVNELNLARDEDPAEVSLARERIERDVIGRLVRGQAAFTPDPKGAVDFVLQVRQLALGSAPREDLAEVALAMVARRQVGQRAAGEAAATADADSKDAEGGTGR